MYFSIKIEHSSLCGEECSLLIFFDIFHSKYIVKFKMMEGYLLYEKIYN